eukprot:6208654-Pleurochrysis_carterae.AAC.3
MRDIGEMQAPVSARSQRAVEHSHPTAVVITNLTKHRHIDITWPEVLSPLLALPPPATNLCKTTPTN